MQCEIHDCEKEATYQISASNGTSFVCYEHLKSIIDGFEKLKMRRFCKIQSIHKERINETV